MSYLSKIQLRHKAQKYSDYVKQKNAESDKNKPDPTVSAMYNNAGAQVYSGGTRRLDRYRFFDIMETDSTVDTALAILTDFITQNNDNEDEPFQIKYKDEVSEKEVSLLKNALQLWCELNKFDVKIYDYVRDTLKYGDTFYIRDPETNELIYVDPMNVEAIIVDEQQGKIPQIYRIKDVDINLVTKSITTNMNKLSSPYGNMGITPTYTVVGNAGGIKENGQLSRGALDVDAKHVIQISLNTKGGILWPFGDSVCSKGFKIYKQKELLSDSSIIFRLQRAVDRRVFKINTAGMPAHKASAYIERFKNEITSTRIPSKNFLESGVYNVADNIYNPMSLLDDIYLPVNEDGKGSDVTTLQGQTNWEILPEIKFFDDALIRSFGLPQSYFTTQGDDNSKNYNAGKLGELLIVEMRMAKMIRRYQKIIIDPLDKEFKKFCEKIGVEIDNSIFSLDFHDNMNFGEWVKLEIETNYIQHFKDMSGLPFISTEFALKKYLNWSEDEIEENKRLWLIENKDKLKDSTIDTDFQSDLTSGLASVGIPKVSEELVNAQEEDNGGAGGGDLGGDLGGNFGGDMGGMEDMGDMEDLGGENMGSEGGLEDLTGEENLGSSEEELNDEIEEETGNEE